MKKSAACALAVSLLLLGACSGPVSSVSSEMSSAKSEASSEQVSSEESSVVSSEESSNEVSSSEDVYTDVVTLATPNMLGFSGTKSITEEIQINSVFSIMPGCEYDGSGKETIYDGKTVTSASDGRFKLKGESAATYTEKKSIKIIVGSAGKLIFAAQSANSGDTSRTWSLATADGEIYTSPEGVPGSTYQIYEYTLEEGTYYLYSKVNGINIYFLEFVQHVKLGNETGFKVNAAAMKCDYLIGDTFDSAGLSASALYTSGAEVSLAAGDYLMDSSSVDMGKAGTYKLKITYKDYPAQEVEIRVHAVKDIVAYSSVIQTGTGSKTWFRTPKVYVRGNIIDTSHVLVKAVGDDGNEYDVTPESTLAAPSTKTAGENQISVSYTNDGKEFSCAIPITIVDGKLLTKDADGEYTIKVDPSVGADGTVVDGVLNFKTVQNAHDFYLAKNVSADRKKIEIADGTYEEKVYVEIPNLSFIGSDKDKVKISYGADSDSKDAGGHGFSTYGSGTVMVSENATGFRASGISFVNSKFSTMDEYNSSKDANKQACALTCDADQTYLRDCAFYGFQDTLYSRLHTQVYENCFVQGMTDFIFGEDGNFLFKNCEIKSLNRGSTTNGGYVCAPKPKASTDAERETRVGFVFDSCKFTAEEGVTDGTVSLARPWGAEAMVYVVNSTLGSHISKKAYGDQSVKNNARFEAMSGHTPDKASFAEYGNTGDGAIAEAVKGGKILSADEYATLTSSVSKIFGAILTL